ncbi:head GIN domain-containing protein [uncultured Sphingomonas sp.]|uniref:head GIN domain-containing protein n=1 Tax=uncultured Sphingomonas sp. TaxID=158754 RepID=UPI0025E79D22|nr:head GIN domain-containing protein [uncultured Sphingomonas sp.]
MRLLVLAALISATVAGPAVATTRTFPVGGFDRIRNTVPFDVRVHTGARPSARASGPQKILDRLVIDVRNGELVVGTRRGSWISSWTWNRNSEPVVIDIAVPALSAAALDGPGAIRIDRVQGRSFTASLSGPGDMTIASLQAGNVDFRLAGPGNIVAAGRVASARLDLSGPGDIRAMGLTVRDAAISVSGPGSIALTATGAVRGSLSGPGDITVRGGAQCDIRKSGPGAVHCG